mgnify:CR=1 FL=1
MMMPTTGASAILKSLRCAAPPGAETPEYRNRLRPCKRTVGLVSYWFAIPRETLCLGRIRNGWRGYSMKVEEPPPIQHLRQVGTERSVPPADATGGSRDDGRSSPDEREVHEELQDVAAVHDVSEDDLSPNMWDAMVGLIAEVASLREEMEQSRNRLEYLTALADQDSVLQLLNRRAFVRELTRALSIANRRNTNSSLVFLEVENL